MPFVDTYYGAQSLHYKGFFVEYKHYCAHQVITSKQKDNDRLYRKYGDSPATLSVIKIGYEWEIK
jgi:hypothetical protein